MSARAKILQRMYEQGRVTLSGLRKAVEDTTITAAEYEEIIGKPYAGDEDDE